MPIRNYPFQKVEIIDIVYRPYLPVRITNPETDDYFDTWGLIDTGADESAVPHEWAPLLNHDLDKGIKKNIQTASGPGIAYGHTSTLTIYQNTHCSVPHLTTHSGLTLQSINVDFSPGLHCMLIGVKNILENFDLNIDYRNKTFSLIY